MERLKAYTSTPSVVVVANIREHFSSSLFPRSLGIVGTTQRRKLFICKYQYCLVEEVFGEQG